jgi:hypothetical protein
MKASATFWPLALWLVCCAGGVAIAEPAHKARASAAVDLDAAAKATAALYANMPMPAAKPQVPAAPAAAVRSSPLLPTPTAAAQSLTPVAAPVPMPLDGTAVAAPPGEVWQGAYQCEHSEKVQLRPDAVAEQVELQWKGQRWKMRRIDSRSGAMRLEDSSARMVWIQLPNKSMLLDQRLGKRLLDECQHAEQVQTAARMKTHPLPTLFDTTGMGR